jgi:hypothetical protein
MIGLIKSEIDLTVTSVISARASMKMTTKIAVITDASLMSTRVLIWSMMTLRIDYAQLAMFMICNASENLSAPQNVSQPTYYIPVIPLLLLRRQKTEQNLGEARDISGTLICLRSFRLTFASAAKFFVRDASCSSAKVASNS